MTAEGVLGDAAARVESELEHVAAKSKAFRRFERTVSETAPLDRRAVAGGRPATGGTLATAGGGDDRCRRLRERFLETVHPHSLDDIDGGEPVAATIREELGDEAALALAPNGGNRFTPGVKRGVLSAIETRRRELRTLEGALERERESLREVGDARGSMVDAIETFGDRRLLEFGFEELRERHERLADYRTRCDRLAAERQDLLDSTTGREARTGLAHRGLVEYLYESPGYPALDALVRLDRGCAAGQRALRDHLCRRV